MVVEVILKLIIDASSTQLYMLGWRVSPANFVDEVGLIHESTYNMDVFVATTSCFLQGSGLYIAVIVEVILKLLLDASSTQQYMFAWRVYLANFVGEKMSRKGTFSHTFGAGFTIKRVFTLQFLALPF